jgi:hypothetical protein
MKYYIYIHKVKDLGGRKRKSAKFLVCNSELALAKLKIIKDYSNSFSPSYSIQYIIKNLILYDYLIDDFISSNNGCIISFEIFSDRMGISTHFKPIYQKIIKNTRNRTIKALLKN